MRVEGFRGPKGRSTSATSSRSSSIICDNHYPQSRSPCCASLTLLLIHTGSRETGGGSRRSGDREQQLGNKPGDHGKETPENSRGCTNWNEYNDPASTNTPLRPGWAVWVWRGVEFRTEPQAPSWWRTWAQPPEQRMADHDSYPKDTSNRFFWLDILNFFVTVKCSWS